LAALDRARLAPRSTGKVEMSTNEAPKYWTVTVQVHEVTPEHTSDRYGKSEVKQRQVIESFNTTVRAGNEAEAYRKAMALLEVNRPQSEAMRRPGSETLTIPSRPMHTGD
jgi:hypothetical protein